MGIMFVVFSIIILSVDFETEREKRMRLIGEKEAEKELREKEAKSKENFQNYLNRG